MKKSIFSSILIIFFALTLVIVTPLTSFADTFLDNEIAWSLNGSSYSPVIHKVSSLNYARIYNYSASTGWLNGTFSNVSSITYQLPSPISTQNNLTVTSTTAVQVTGYADSDDQSIIGFDFNLGFCTTINTLNPTVDDYICFALPFVCTQPINSVTYSWGNIVTGNAYEPTQFYTDERMLVYDPYNRSGIGTSGIINTSLWSTPWSTSHYIGLLYCNIPYTDFLNYNIPDSYIPIFSINFNSNSGFNVYYFEPIFYKVGYNEEITVLNNISNNVEIISDILQQGSYTPPPDTSDIDDIIQHGGGRLDEHLYMHVGEVDTVYRGLDFTSISSGLAWYADTLATIYARLTFLKGIYGVIILFMIFNLLKGGILQKVNDKEEEKPVTMRIYEGK